MEQSVLKTPRIGVIDALRGLAIMAIVLLHNIEHSNYYLFPETTLPWLDALNKDIWREMFWFFGGKAYAIFALMFGLSFFIQFDNQQRRGADFRGRFAWRLVLLFGFGLLHSVFYCGDILLLYAMIGFVLIPVCKLPSKAVLIIATILLLQPFELGRFIYALGNPDYQVANLSGPYFGAMTEAWGQTSFWVLVKANLKEGIPAGITWAWENGRFFQTSGLFMVGMLLGREKLFSDSEKTINFWRKVLYTAIPLFLVAYWCSRNVPGMCPEGAAGGIIRMVITSWSNAAFMFILVSSFVLLWYWTSFKNIQQILIPYGKMSLTNYISGSIIAAFLYFECGFGLAAKVGVAGSFLIGVATFILQLYFCRWWLKSHDHGPLEGLWRKGTWIFSKK